MRILVNYEIDISNRLRFTIDLICFITVLEKVKTVKNKLPEKSKNDAVTLFL